MTDAWQAVDDYVAELFGLRDDVLEAALSRSREAGLPEIEVTPAQGTSLEILVHAIRARRVLERGNGGGGATGRPLLEIRSSSRTRS